MFYSVVFILDGTSLEQNPFCMVHFHPTQEKLLAELTPELNDRVQYAQVSCVEEKDGKYRSLIENIA